jgi:hypothetical protein
MPDLTAQQRLEKMEAVHQIQNLVGRYEFWHVANLHTRCLGLYALKTPGVRIEMDWGVFEGREGVERFFLGYHGGHDAERPGSQLAGDMHLHTQTTPVIEVADDLRTAQGVWISPGNETIPLGPGGSMKAFWIWLKYGFDFTREDGQWKIWHQHVYSIFMCPYETSWVDMEPLPPRRELPPDRAPDRYLPQPSPWQYGTDKPHLNIPAPPGPYETFDDAAAY